jgi:hypothetical protein
LSDGGERDNLRERQRERERERERERKTERETERERERDKERERHRDREREREREIKTERETERERERERQRQREIERDRERETREGGQRTRAIKRGCLTLTVRLEDFAGESKPLILEGLFESDGLLPPTELLDRPDRLKNRKPPRDERFVSERSSPLDWIDENDDPLGK